MTEPLTLNASSGNAQIDEITAGVLTLMDLQFGERISGCYFEGSCADGALTPLSDIDLTLVFHERCTPLEQQRFAALAAACRRISSRSLDIGCTDTATLLHADTLPFQPDCLPVLQAIMLKCASVCIYGADLRSAIPLVSHAVYRRTLMHFPYPVLAGQRKHPPTLPIPLPLLDPTDEFYGYTGRRLRAADGTLQPSTKRIVHASGFIATALVALNTSVYVANKRTVLTVYRQQINDEWAEHLENVHTYCRLKWGYAVPTAPEDRSILRAICAREHAFENHFLAIYQDYLRREQHTDDPVAQQFARERLARLA
jgi:hypothetical protein